MPKIIYGGTVSREMGGEGPDMEYDQGSVLKRELHKMGF